MAGIRPSLGYAAALAQRRPAAWHLLEHPEAMPDPSPQAAPGGTEPPLLYHLVYCSRAAPGIDEDAVGRIVATARRHNPQAGITGLLVFGSGVFFQWLEGPRTQIDLLMQRLQADPRHAGVVTLDSTEEARARLFPDWDMEPVDAAQIRDVLEDALATTRDASSAAMLRGMLGRLDAGGLDALPGR